MADSPNTDSTQANIDDLVKELSRPQNTAPSATPAPSMGSVPVQPKPVMPPVMPKPIPPSMPSSTIPIKPAIPSAPAPVPAPVVPKEYQSNIRTMADDLSKLKAGQQPQGMNVPRTVQDQQKPAPAPASKPAVPPVMPPKMPSIQTNVAQPPKPAMPAPAPTMPPKPPIPAPVTAPKMAMPPKSAPAPAPTKVPDQKSQFYVPEASAAPAGGGVNRTIIFIGIAVAAVVLAIVYWFFLIRQPSEVAVAPTPVATVVPTATPVMGLDAVFPSMSGTIVLPASGNPASAFNGALATQAVNAGSFGVLNVTNSPASNSSQGLGTFDLFDRFLISYPAALRAGSGDSRILVFGQDENFNTKGAPIQTTSTRVVFVTEVASSSASLLESWEPSMTPALAGIMGFDQTKNNKAFTSTNYQGQTIWFKNFPYPDHSIDYALVPYQGNTYWVLASSRESMFAAISAFLSSQ